MNDFQNQFDQVAKKVSEELKVKLKLSELFSEDFLVENDIHKTINEIFDDAGVEFPHSSPLSQDEKQMLISALPSEKYKTWDDFAYAAGRFQIKKRLDSLGLLRKE